MHGGLPIIIPSTYTVSYGPLDDIDNSKRQNFALCHCSHKQARCIYAHCHIMAKISLPIDQIFRVTYGKSSEFEEEKALNSVLLSNKLALLS